MIGFSSRKIVTGIRRINCKAWTDLELRWIHYQQKGISTIMAVRSPMIKISSSITCTVLMRFNIIWVRKSCKRKQKEHINIMKSVLNNSHPVNNKFLAIWTTIRTSKFLQITNTVVKNSIFPLLKGSKSINTKRTMNNRFKIMLSNQNLMGKNKLSNRSTLSGIIAKHLKGSLISSLRFP